MKTILLIMLYAVPAISIASGCMPDDVYLEEEKNVLSLGQFDAHVNCENSKCMLSVFNKVEYHELLPQGKGNLSRRSLGKVQVNIVRQYWVSSCSELARYILSVDFEGVRFRELADLDYL